MSDYIKKIIKKCIKKNCIEDEYVVLENKYESETTDGCLNTYYLRKAGSKDDHSCYNRDHSCYNRNCATTLKELLKKDRFNTEIFDYLQGEGYLQDNDKRS